MKCGAYTYGYTGDFWTLDRIAQLIWQLFAVRYHPSAVWHILRRKVQAMLTEHPRLHVYHFPRAAPEFNPMECVWQQVDHFTASLAPRNRAEQRTNVMAGVARIRHFQRRLGAGFTAAKLTLARR